ncbi:hypothetical protein [Olivibacter domesticus]|uniref:Uncharacterized protein n=1 Tax=Olivibacter domesticus TaxID=407022 RepID=A0A1H7HMX7_OLID1|nr:hypothetical protein [Olivibacter domesticus]SEK50987.1 hypothetical protein SAMN05661044_00413 [Olivibacter domesticus]
MKTFNNLSYLYLCLTNILVNVSRLLTNALNAPYALADEAGLVEPSNNSVRKKTRKVD